ncbi:hypothetical protein DYY88_04575 [Leptolyngbya iicbica LK]|uniref:Uncharacterized protein n=2 Tax=Cyanophyceae TaxID=3028117 RepID=A0A4V2E3I1_9CYAN|nr:hypothetical protein DYY88_04575 [Leptolyngbya sp. LK]
MTRVSPLPRLIPMSVQRRWFEKVMAAIALLNLGLVVFDLSYIPLRNVYRTIAPNVTEWYGQQFKGITPHPFTVDYLEKVSELETLVAEGGLVASSSERMLTELRTASDAMIAENPFDVANKSGTLERIKELMRRHVEATTGQPYESATEAFNTFWTKEYLSEAGYQSQVQFFNQTIRPLIETNYFRGIGFNGKPANNFIAIDSLFITIFSIELLLRVMVLRRRYPGLKIWDAILFRWYDLLLITPFSLFAPTWLLLRVIPVVTRIKQSKLLNLDPLRQRIVSFLIASVVVELTEFVLIRIINQLQSSIKKGNLAAFLMNDKSQPSQYINLGEVNEISAIAQQVSSTVVDETLPKVRPQIEALLTYTVSTTVTRSPLYRQLGHLPGFNTLIQNTVREIVDSLCETLYGNLDSKEPDAQRAALVKALVENFNQSFRTDLQENHGVEKIEALAFVWLEEIKINYLRQIAIEDEAILQERSRELYAMTRITPKP